MLPDERALLTRIAQGDQEALQCLYAAYRPRLWSYLWRQLDRDAGWTEELVQDVWLAVWRSAGSYRDEAQVATWLFRIAHNLAANARRARARRIQPEPLEDKDDGQEQRDAGVSHLPEDRILDRLALAEALDHLSPKHREVLDLAFYQGFGLSEIAAILDVPVGTVKSRLSYARRALQAQLAHSSLKSQQSQYHSNEKRGGVEQHGNSGLRVGAGRPLALPADFNSASLPYHPRRPQGLPAVFRPRAGKHHLARPGCPSLRKASSHWDSQALVLRTRRRRRSAVTESSECAHCREALPWYAAGTASDAERASVELHLATCADCAHALAEWRALAGVVQAEGRGVEPALSFTASSWERLSARLPAPAAPSATPAAAPAPLAGVLCLPSPIWERGWG